MSEEESSSIATTSLGAIVFAHQFIAKSRKSMERADKELRMQAPGAARGRNMRQAILEKEELQEMNLGGKSRNWDMLKKKITSAKITDALTALKFEVNGKKFTALRPLGEGGYSQIYEVYNSDKKMFALKVVNLSAQSTKMKNDLIREILFLEKLRNCVNVVKAFEYQIIETEDTHKMFVLLEKGETDLYELVQKHKNQKTLTPTRLRHFWEQMLTAVLDVHRANIVHADIKPGNFLSVGGELKIIDFGMACELPPGQDHYVRNSVCGTREYMAPEVYQGVLFEDDDDPDAEKCIKITPKVDVWALGIFLYQTVYGILPFAEVPGGKIAKIVALCGKHPVEFAKKENLDPQLLDTMKRCLEKDPAKRATIEELLVHPYLQPLHQAQSSTPRVCFSCKSKERAMARIKHKRTRDSNSLNL